MEVLVALGLNHNQLGIEPVRWVRPAQQIPLGASVRAFGTLGLTAAMLVFMAAETLLNGSHLRSLVLALGLRSEVWSWTDITGYSRVFTYAFLHSNGQHFFWNVTLLLLVGSVIEWRIGLRAVGLLFVIGAAVAALSHLLMFPNEARPLIGASGIVATLFGAAVVIAGNVGLRIRVPRTDRWLNLNLRRLLLVWLAFQFAGLASIYAAADEPLSVAYWAHLAGFGVGLAGGFIYRRRAQDEAQSALVPSFAGAGD